MAYKPAKDGTFRGGARSRSGPPRRALVDRIKDGTTNKSRVIQPMEISDLRKKQINRADLDDVANGYDGSASIDDIPEPMQWLNDQQGGAGRNFDFVARERYDSMMEWIAAHHCQGIVHSDIVEQYAMAFARHVQCEQILSQFGVVLNTKQGAISSPYAVVSDKYSRMANNLYNQIVNIVRENASVKYDDGIHEDTMELLLRQRQA